MDMFKLYLVIFTCIFAVSCSDSKSSSKGSGEKEALAYSWSNIGNQSAGYISDIKVHPDNSDEVWASGDDGGGLFRSLDGGSSWSQVVTTPLNLTTHALEFDPNNSNTLYAPSRFGRGFAKSNDSGATWQVLGAGLPQDTTDNLTKADRFLDGLVIHPGNSDVLYACLRGGLYHSDDGGANFTKLNQQPDDSGCSAIAISNGGTGLPIEGSLVIGTEESGVYISTNGGSSWTTIKSSVGNTCTKVTDMEFSDNALYVSFNLGEVAQSTNYTSLTSINTPDNISCSAAGGFAQCNTANCHFHSLFWTKLEVASVNSNAAEDIIYAGTVKPVLDNTLYGLYKSTDGGGNWTSMNSGLNGSSNQSLAIDPNDAQTVFYGTFGDGIYRSEDGGANWSLDADGLSSIIVLGLAEDPANLNHLLSSGTVGLNDGNGGFYESFTRGNSWSKVTSLNGDAIALDISPLNSSHILASVWRQGIFRSTNGTAGPWIQDSGLFPRDVNLSNIVRDKVNANKVYASAHNLRFPTSVTSNFGIYFSSDDGETWAQKVSTPAGATVVPHPSKENEAIATSGNEVYATTNNFDSYVSLGLSALASSDVLLSAAFDPENSSKVLVGSASSKLYFTENYNSSGNNVSWKEIESPAKDVFIRKLHITEKGWFALCWMGDIFSTPQSTEGIMFSANEGEDWTFLDEGMGVSQLTYDFIPSQSGNSDFLVGLWDGGLLFLDVE